MPTDKKRLRADTLKKRQNLSEEYASAQNRIIINFITNSPLFENSLNITAYYPYKNEVNLLPFLAHRNKNILFPKVVKGSRKLDFYIVESTDDFEKGSFGIMEPKITLPKIEIEEIDLFLAPGVAFSKTGERIGYGGGYYDTTLQYRNKNSHILGICFDVQIIPEGFSEKWDIRLDGLISESGITNF